MWWTWQCRDLGVTVSAPCFWDLIGWRVNSRAMWLVWQQCLSVSRPCSWTFHSRTKTTVLINITMLTSSSRVEEGLWDCGSDRLNSFSSWQCCQTYWNFNITYHQWPRSISSISYFWRKKIKNMTDIIDIVTWKLKAPRNWRRSGEIWREQFARAKTRALAPAGSENLDTLLLALHYT